MDKNTKWLAVICQEYSVEKDGGRPVLATLVVQLSLRAVSANEAATKAEEWLKKSGIKDAYVDSVCMDGIEEIDIVSTSDQSKVWDRHIKFLSFLTSNIV